MEFVRPRRRGPRVGYTRTISRGAKSNLCRNARNVAGDWPCIGALDRPHHRATGFCSWHAYSRAQRGKIDERNFWRAMGRIRAPSSGSVAVIKFVISDNGKVDSESETRKDISHAWSINP